MASPATLTALTVEHLAHALGIDARVPRFSWKLVDRRPGAAQTGYQIQVATDDRFTGGSIVWDSGQVASSSSVLVPYGASGDAKPIGSCTRYFFRVCIRDARDQWTGWSDTDWFETAFLDAEWVGRWVSGPEWSDQDDQDAWKPGGGHPAPYLRREFKLSGKPRSARLYAAARGLMELSLNGSRIGDAVLSPGWTDYNSRCQYVTYDVTGLLQPGENAIDAILGDGWYSGRIAWVHGNALIGTDTGRDQRQFGSIPQLLCELHVELDDGGSVVIASDGEWTWTTGPILKSDIYDGESYDARIVPDGWKPARVVGPATNGWDGSDTVRNVRGTLPLLDAKAVPPVRPVGEIVPVAITEPESGRHIYDLGQNIAGWARIALSGKPGDTVTIRYGEMLQADGTLYVENLRSALATDTYTFASSDQIVWEPRFTFHGFRYVELSGIAIDPQPEQVTGIVLHNDLPITGSFTTSHKLLNQLQSNIEWGQRGNYLEVPTDCPQRDERLGWTGDAQVFIPTASFNMDVSTFFAKWQRDLADSQSAGGVIPSIAPLTRYMQASDENDGGPAWSDAVIICPWTVYTKYGDTRILEEHFDSMRRFVTSMENRSKGLIRSDEFFTPWGGFGDWVAMDAPENSCIGATPKDLIGTAYFARCTDLLRRIAALLGKRDDELTLAELHRRIVLAFRAEFVSANGRILGDTQTGYTVALAFDLLPEEQRSAAVNRLVRMLERRDFRMTTGFVGTVKLCPVLARYGRADVAYKLLLQEAFPSWLYTVNQGATTMWERWNSWTEEKGFGPVSMNSFNHYAYGSIGAWMYERVAGLSVDMERLVTGEPPIRIAPLPGYGLTHAKASLDTPFGHAESAWKIASGSVTLDVTIPANATARVEVPAGVSDIEVDAEYDDHDVEELVVLEESSGGVYAFNVGSGSYSFSWEYRG